MNGEDLEPEWQARFCRNIFEDSQRLTETTETLVRYLDEDAAQQSTTTLPQDEVDAWLAKTEWRCDALERDPDADIPAILDGEAALQSGAARRMAQDMLQRYAEDVRAVPGAELNAVLGQGPLEIAQRFGVDLPCVFRRLASLPALPAGQPFGLVACDGSGTLTYRKPVPGFALPRFSAACPLWPLFQALQRPMAPVLQAVTMAGREEASFEATAISSVTYPLGFGSAAVVEAWMLLTPVRGDGTANRIGTSCRVCSVEACVARREPSIINVDGL